MATISLLMLENVPKGKTVFFGEATAKSGMIATVKVKDTDFQKTDFLG